MKKSLTYILAFFYSALCFSQVDVKLMAQEKTTKEKNVFNTVITFDLFIENNGDDAIYFPYNANPVNDVFYENQCDKNSGYNLLFRFYKLDVINDTFALITRYPIVDTSFNTCLYQPLWVKLLQLNYYGHPKDGQHLFSDKYFDRITTIKIAKNSKYHIRFMFDFRTNKRFSKLLKKGFYVKIVFFKEGMDHANMIDGDIRKVFTDSTLSPYIIHKAFSFDWSAKKKMQADTLFYDKTKSFWEDPGNLYLHYIGGGW